MATSNGSLAGSSCGRSSCGTTPAALCYWAGLFVLFSGAGLIAPAVWPGLQPFPATLALAADGVACVPNVRFSRTLAGHNRNVRRFQVEYFRQ